MANGEVTPQAADAQAPAAEPVEARPDAPGPTPEGATVRLRLVVAYDGAGYHGFAAQQGSDVPTVAGALADALARVLRMDAVELTCAGRTDRGVHAWGQVVTLDVPEACLDAARPRGGGDRADALDRVQRAVTKLCGPTIVVRAVDVVDPSFDARFSATARRYRYMIVNRPWPDPFLAHQAWHVPAPLDLRAMTLACDPFIGEHDFSSFCRRPKRADGEAASLVRRVRSARWEAREDGVLWFWVEANAFCHQMVRSITGTIVEVGLGRRRAGDLLGVIAAGDRRAAGDLAPPQGLCLWSVAYPGFAS